MIKDPPIVSIYLKIADNMIKETEKYLQHTRSFEQLQDTWRTDIKIQSLK
jgi:hypothetical protein